MARPTFSELTARQPRLPRQRRKLLALAGLGLGVCLAAAAGPLAAEPLVRTFRQVFPMPPGSALRLANLAGQVELVPGAANQVVVDATVHGEASGAGETRWMVDGMQWVRAQDGKGRDEWALSYPVERYRSFFYPQPRDKSESSFWSLFDNSSSSTTFRGERVRVYTGRRSSAPTLYADLRIAVPPAAAMALRNLVGNVHGGSMQGDLTLDTGNGDIHLASFAGQLRLDTGSGDIELGLSRGETAIDTGSGDVVVHQLVGNASVDTGSGDVRIDKVEVGRLTLHTGSGDVTVHDGAAGKLVADTGSGEVRVLGVEVDELVADTGSGNVVIVSSLGHTRELTAKTGSGDVRVTAGPAASFDVVANQGSGDLRVDYPDALLRHSGHRDKVVGARRGDGRTAIHISTHSGDCVIEPAGRSASRE